MCDVLCVIFDREHRVFPDSCPKIMEDNSRVHKIEIDRVSCIRGGVKDTICYANFCT